MKGLIPFMLNPEAPGRRTSIFSPTKHERNDSTMSMPSTTPALPEPQLPRSQSRPVLPSHSQLVPRTQGDWKRTIADIKRQHVNKRFRACSARCNEILDKVKDPSDVQPAYLIFLHFYAAASIEMCAKPLNAVSQYRTSLLQKAREHYDAATSLIQRAEEAVAAVAVGRVEEEEQTKQEEREYRLSPPRKAIQKEKHEKHQQQQLSSPISSSPRSSLHSPSGSISSQSWSVGTGFSSPVMSCHEDAGNTPGLRLNSQFSSPVKKAVSFDLPSAEPPLPLFAKAVSPQESHFRPDSPTLGFGAEFFIPRTGSRGDDILGPLLEDSIASALGGELDALVPPECSVESPPVPLAQLDELEAEIFFRGLIDEAHDDHEGDEVDHGEEYTPRRCLTAVHRYREHLSALRGRLASHIAEVDAALQEGSATGKHPSRARRLRRGSSNNDGDDNASRRRDGGLVGLVSENEELRVLERQARIERLRGNGWQRRRFDAARYERLCDDVLAEMD